MVRPAATGQSAEPGQRKRGVQKGHKGGCRALLDASQIDHIFDCKPVEVCDCGAAVQVLPDEPVRHQVFDVPPVKAQVDEYRRYAGCCLGCGKTHRAALPAGVPSGQIGPHALALIRTMGTHYHLTRFKIRDLLARLMGVDFSVGAISQAHGKVAQALKAPMLEVAAHVARAPVKQLDETSYSRAGAGNWAWDVVTPKVVFYSLLPSRARYVALDRIGAKPSGIVVSDRYAVYDFVDVKQRQICWAHLLRDLTLRLSGCESQSFDVNNASIRTLRCSELTADQLTLMTGDSETDRRKRRSRLRSPLTVVRMAATRRVLLRPWREQPSRRFSRPA